MARRLLWTTLAVVVLVAAGCDSAATSESGGAAGAPGATGATGAGGPPPSAAGSAGTATDWRRWAQCMRDHGIAMPDLDPQTGEPVGGAQRPDKGTAAFGAAVRACAALEPAGSADHNAPLTPAELAQKRQWAECMRGRGVPVPDPDPNDPNGPHFERLPNMPPVAVVDRALNACRDKLPARIR
jgi:hypothetical protein